MYDDINLFVCLQETGGSSLVISDDYWEYIHNFKKYWNIEKINIMVNIIKWMNTDVHRQNFFCYIWWLIYIFCLQEAIKQEKNIFYIWNKYIDIIYLWKIDSICFIKWFVFSYIKYYK